MSVRTFKTTGACTPDKNYMVDLSSRLRQIKSMVDQGLYFTVNRARQYGKTTMLTALRPYLAPQYEVISLDFQGISSGGFDTESSFIKALCRQILQKQKRTNKPGGIMARMKELTDRADAGLVLDELFAVFNDWCDQAEKPMVLIIDEIDSAANNQVFLDFLAQLRLQYLQRETGENPSAFQSVILAGVTDIKNMKKRLRPDEAHKFNSPWNIAADFNVDMSFSEADIAGMLREYESDHHTGMDVETAAQTIEDYTSGYPFLVSRICQLLDADSSLSWTAHSIGEIVRRILLERNTLFDSLMGKVHDNKKLYDILWRILFAGEAVSYNPDDIAISDAEMYGFVRNNGGTVQIANRIFETRLYNFFLSQAELNSSAYQAATDDKQQFIEKGRLDMDRVIERFAVIYDDLYGDKEETFDEAEGRQRFLLYVRPIINGTGNYYVEAETRNRRRMDLVIDYKGEQFVIELKIWRGRKYHEDGEIQFCGYLDRMHLDKGYLLTYSFNRDKQPGVTRKIVAGKELVEAVV